MQQSVVTPPSQRDWRGLYGEESGAGGAWKSDEEENYRILRQSRSICARSVREDGALELR
jgi:hypothetical protein